MSENKVTNKRKLILDTAEELFAARGYDAVTVREITSSANVRLASIHYYFTSKELLFQEVILRRAKIISDLRISLLDKVDLKAKNIDGVLNGICNAFIYPLMELSTEGDIGWKHYGRLLAITSLNDSSGFTQVFSEFDPCAMKFIGAIQSALPSISEQDSFYAFQFLLGSTISTFTESKRLDQLSNGKFLGSELIAICPRLINYTAAGIKAMAAK